MKCGGEPYLPRCRSPGRQDGFDHARHEGEGVFPGEDGVDDGEDDEGVDEEPRQDGDHVVRQLLKHRAQILHLHQLRGNQEDDPHRRVPEGGRGKRDTSISEQF